MLNDPTAQTNLIKRLSLKRPVCGLAVTAIAGCIFGRLFPSVHAAIWFAAGSMLLLSLVLIRARYGFFLLYGTFFCLCHLSASISIIPVAPRHIDPFADAPGRYAVLLGDILYAPETKTYNSNKSRSSSYPFKLLAHYRDGEWIKTDGIILVRHVQSGAATPPRYGQRWILEGPLRPLEHARADYFKTIKHALNVQPAQGRRVAESGGNAFLSWCFRQREKAYHLIQAGTGDRPAHTALLAALILGKREHVDSSIYRLFAQTGALHILAISGLHVGMIAMMLTFVIRLAGVPRPYWILILGPALLLYIATTGMKASAVRAGIMACCYWSAPLFNRKADAVSALGLAAVLILLIAPGQVFDAGFQISFTVVLGLLMMAPSVYNLFPTGDQFTWRPQGERGARDFITRFARQMQRGFYRLLAASLTAWAASLPFIIFYSNTFSPVAILGNMIVIPLAFAVLLSGCITIVLGALWIGFATPLSLLNGLLIDLLLHILEALRTLPFSYAYFRTPAVIEVIALYAIMLSLCLTKKRWRWVAAAAALLTAGIWVVAESRPTGLDICVADAGHQYTAILSMNRRHVLINTGSHYHFYTLNRQLKEKGINRLDRLILQDEAAGQEEIIDTLRDIVDIKEINGPGYAAQPKSQREPDAIHMFNGIDRKGEAPPLLLAYKTNSVLFIPYIRYTQAKQLADDPHGYADIWIGDAGSIERVLQQWDVDRKPLPKKLILAGHYVFQRKGRRSVIPEHIETTSLDEAGLITLHF